jgi:hypothetical protein
MSRSIARKSFVPGNLCRVRIIDSRLALRNRAITRKKLRAPQTQNAN